MTWLLAHAANLAWIAGAWLFLAAVVVGVRRGRARSQRLFVDEPARVLSTLSHDRTHLHEMDSA